MSVGRTVSKSIGKAWHWTNRHVPIPLLLISGVAILVLFLNDETSIMRNYEYQQQIQDLQREIQFNKDSAAYYRHRREALMSTTEDLEHIAREQYHMQRADEDVYLVK